LHSFAGEENKKKQGEFSKVDEGRDTRQAGNVKEMADTHSECRWRPGGKIQHQEEKTAGLMGRSKLLLYRNQLGEEIRKNTRGDRPPGREKKNVDRQYKHKVLPKRLDRKKQREESLKKREGTTERYEKTSHRACCFRTVNGVMRKTTRRRLGNRVKNVGLHKDYTTPCNPRTTSGRRNGKNRLINRKCAGRWDGRYSHGHLSKTGILVGLQSRGLNCIRYQLSRAGPIRN